MTSGSPMDLRGLPPDCQRFCLSAPGNLLLMGEYAVTEPGGQGIWLAPEIRAVLHCRPAAAFRFRGRWPGGGFDWSPADGIDAPALLQAVLGGWTTLGLTEAGGAAPLGPWELILDSSAFFSPEGRKLGYGSSAAACLLLSAALLQLWTAGLDTGRRAQALDGLLQWSVLNHRRFQGGRGSGYDLFCSYHGGIGRFTGGPVPRGARLPRPLESAMPPFRLAKGPAAVRTASAIVSWQAFRDRDPAAAAGYLTGCQRRADAFAASRDRLRLLRALDEAGSAGRELGLAIGVPADLPPIDEQAATCPILLRKALGAGNETFIEFLDDRDQVARASPVEPAGPGIARRGLEAWPVATEASARGKLLLFGEHVALYGWPACGTPLDCATAIRFSPAAAAGQTGTGQGFPGLPQELAVTAAGLLARLAAALPGLVIPAGSFWIDSDVPLGNGFGSSAAFSAALARLGMAWAGKQGLELPQVYAGDTPADPIRLARHLDGFFHGQASGIDTGLALADGPLAFAATPGGSGPPTASSLDLSSCRTAERWLVHAAVPRQGNTRSLVAEVRAAMERLDPPSVHAMAALGEISRQAIDLLAGKGSAGDLGHLANQAQSLLGQLGLSSPELEAALAIGRAAGSPGGKLSGAGGGGAFYLWADSGEAAERIRAALTMAGACGESGWRLSAPPRCLRLDHQCR
jgi:mevalonate kinase